jgi:hypothetical protein
MNQRRLCSDDVELVPADSYFEVQQSSLQEKFMPPDPGVFAIVLAASTFSTVCLPPIGALLLSILAATQSIS